MCVVLSGGKRFDETTALAIIVKQTAKTTLKKRKFLFFFCFGLNCELHFVQINFVSQFRHASYDLAIEKIREKKTNKRKRMIIMMMYTQLQR